MDLKGYVMSAKFRYQAGQHLLEVAASNGRWTTAVDGVTVDRWYTSLADAWTAGVTEALRLDAGAPYVFVGDAGAGQQP